MTKSFKETVLWKKRSLLISNIRGISACGGRGGLDSSVHGGKSRGGEDVHIVTEQAWHGSRSGPSRAHSQQHTPTSQAPPPTKPLHKLGTDGSKREPLGDISD